MTRILLCMLLCAGVAHADTLKDTAAFAEAVTRQAQQAYSTARVRSATSWRTTEQLYQRELKKIFYRAVGNTIAWNDDTLIHLDDSRRVSKIVYKGQPGCTWTWTPQKTWYECASGTVELLHGPNGAVEFGPGTHIAAAQSEPLGVSGPHPLIQALNRYTKAHPQGDMHGFASRLLTEQSFAHDVLSSARHIARATQAPMTSQAHARPSPPPATSKTPWWEVAVLSLCAIVVIVLIRRVRARRALSQTAGTQDVPHDSTEEQP